MLGRKVWAKFPLALRKCANRQLTKKRRPHGTKRIRISASRIRQKRFKIFRAHRCEPIANSVAGKDQLPANSLEWLGPKRKKGTTPECRKGGTLTLNRPS